MLKMDNIHVFNVPSLPPPPHMLIKLFSLNILGWLIMLLRISRPTEVNLCLAIGIFPISDIVLGHPYTSWIYICFFYTFPKG